MNDAAQQIGHISLSAHFGTEWEDYIGPEAAHATKNPTSPHIIPILAE